VQFYHALVDDLISREEFSRRVEEKIRDTGGMLDEHTAAMLVVRDAGRSHLRVENLASAATLVCFFARVVQVFPPRSISLPDGEEGTVASFLAGDETGLVRVSLWGEKAEGIREIQPGDVLEIVGRSKKGGSEITALTMREATCEISCDAAPPAAGEGGALQGRAIHLDHRTFTRRDGTPGEMTVAILATEAGIVRLVCWEPALMAGVNPGDAIRIEGAVPRPTDAGVEFTLGAGGSITPGEATFDVTLDDPGDLQEGETRSVRGTVVHVRLPHSFTTRRGEQSWVRNLVLAGDRGEVGVVLWGDDALVNIVPGDEMEIYLGSVRAGRFGGLEIHVGRSAAFSITRLEVAGPVEADGTVVPLPAGPVLDTGTRTFLLRDPYPPGAEVRVTGTVDRGTLAPDRVEWAVPNPAALTDRLHRLIERLERPGT